MVRTIEQEAIQAATKAAETVQDSPLSDQDRARALLAFLDRIQRKKEANSDRN
jgi:hypothetical protein